LGVFPLGYEYLPQVVVNQGKAERGVDLRGEAGLFLSKHVHQLAVGKERDPRSDKECLLGRSTVRTGFGPGRKILRDLGRGVLGRAENW